MEEFLTGDIWKEINNRLVQRQKKIACIAYVTTDTLHLSKNDTLICDASDYEIKFGATSAKILDYYFKQGVEIYTNQDLHSKLLLTSSFLVVGSANLSNKSAKYLVESAVITDNDILLSQAKSFCHNLTKESIPLSQNDIERLLKIKVVKRPFKPTKKSNTREKKFGSRYWYVSLGEMTTRQYEKVEDRIENAKKKVIAKTKFVEDDLGSIYFRKQTKFSLLAKEGDQILMNWKNSNKNPKRFIFPFATILRIDRQNEETIFIHDDARDGEEFTFSKFISLTNKLSLDKPIDKPRRRELSISDAKKLKSLW